MSTSANLSSEADRGVSLDEYRPHVAPLRKEDSSAPISGPESMSSDAPDPPLILIVAEGSRRRTHLRRWVEASYNTYRVECVPSGSEVIEQARCHAPVLIVAETRMPGLCGIEICEGIAQDDALQGTAVLLLVAEDNVTARTAGLRAGADAALTVPVEPGLFAAQVDALCVQRRRYRERVLEEERKGENESKEAFVRRARRAVEQHIDAPEFGPRELAEAVALSYVQCYRRLRDEVEQTPSRFIRTVRLEQAAQLLRNGADSIQGVASAVGFSSASYFTRCFHEEMGQTPSSYRQEAAAPSGGDAQQE